jgi:GNAT superfamily N-acetyltransferase
MALLTWWRGDPLPLLPPLPGFIPNSLPGDEELARLNRLSMSEVRRRRADGHRPCVAEMLGEPVAYGWVATSKASMGELDLSFSLSPEDRYLWDFATTDRWRGRGIYPLLLQSVLAMEASEASRFWINHAPENGPSLFGIERAGFRPVAELSFLRNGKAGLEPVGSLERVEEGSRLLGLPLSQGRLSLCWR